jgi:diaminopimelate decarboxylase
MTKPRGAIPADYRIDSGTLMIAGQSALTLADAGTPCFVYDFGIVAARVAALRAALPPGVAVHYAMKANPLPALVAAIAPLVDAVDVASAGEMGVALAEGAGEVSFAGPGKRDDEITAAIAAGVTLNVESHNECRRALRIADRLGVAPKLAVRVNPDFSIKGSGMRMGGGAAAFGVDAEHAAVVARAIVSAGAEWRGWHIYAGSQSLDADALATTQAATVALAGRLSDEVGATPPLVNLGGGFGIPYFANETPLDIAAIGAALERTLVGRPAVLRDSAFALELGRWLVGEAGVYLTRIVDVKHSRGETFAICDGGLHHQLAASGNFGTVVRRNYPLALAHAADAEPAGDVNVVGCLCTPLDKLGESVALPVPAVGDVVAVFMAGAYGATASPAAFLGHGPAPEVLLGTEG